MIFSLSGVCSYLSDRFVVVDVSGVGYKVFVPARMLSAVIVGSPVSVFTYLHVAEDRLDLFGFVSMRELDFFQQLLSVSGIGPRTALAICDVAAFDEIVAAIAAGRSDVLSSAAGVGGKTAQRIILELQSKMDRFGVDPVTGLGVTQEGIDASEALLALGYRREEVKAALSQVPRDTVGVEDRIKSALKLLGQWKHR